MYNITLYNVGSKNITEHFKQLQYLNTTISDIPKFTIDNIKLNITDEVITNGDKKLEECNIYLRIPYIQSNQINFGLLLTQTLQRMDNIIKKTDISVIHYIDINNKFMYAIEGYYYTLKPRNIPKTLYEDIFDYRETKDETLFNSIKYMYYNKLVSKLLDFLSEFTLTIRLPETYHHLSILLESDLILYTGDIDTFIDSVDFKEYKKVLELRNSKNFKRAKFDTIVDSIFSDEQIDIYSQVHKPYLLYVTSFTEDYFEMLFNSVIFLLNNSNSLSDLRAIIIREKYLGKEFNIEKYNKFLSALYKLQVFEKDNEEFVQSIINVFEPARCS